jgi:hypothetical protein
MRRVLIRRKALIFSLSLICSLAASSRAQSEPSVAQLRSAFAHPPDDCRIMMRWWWFGPAVTKPEIERELEQMKAAGIGGVEIATLYPLALDDPQTGLRNLPFLSDDHIDALRFAADKASQLGLRVDITLTSGWPYGGPHIPIAQAAGKLRVESVPIPPGVPSIKIPAITTGENLLATFVVPAKGSAPDYKRYKQLPISSIADGRIAVPPELDEQSTAIFFISSRTGMTVRRAAIGAEGFVLDHYDQHAIETHLHAVGDRLMEAFGDHPPYAVFSDSLENEGSDWTADFLDQFRRRRGYDLTPYLPALIADTGPEAAAIRHDWGKTLTELANERYLAPLHAWAQQHNTRFRSQTYGTPPVTLFSNQYADLPEGEGKATLLMWRQFSDTRWAASAGHLFGKPVISSETWTWLHSPAFRATPLDMKAEADLHFLQGINQLVGHGWPYSPEIAGEPGWRMYAAGAFNAHNPCWFVMPDLARYLQRVSFALRQGKSVNDVALLLPNDDAWARFRAGNNFSPSIDDSMPDLLGSRVIPQILDAGFNLDFIDADGIETLGIQYPVLILPGIERLPVATYRRIVEYATRGGIVIATRRQPSTAPGFLNAASDARQILEISQRLFSPQGAGHFVQDEAQLGHVIASLFKPDLVLSPSIAEIGFVHRHLSVGDLYFIANTSNHPVRTRAQFRQHAKFAESWDPFTGQTSAVANASDIDISLKPYESRLILFSDSPAKASSLSTANPATETIDLSSGWKLNFAGLNHTVHMATLHSWSDDDAFKYYSGEVTYEKTLELPDRLSRSSLLLDFGEGTPVPKPDPLPEFNMRAYLESPVREAAEIYINGQRAGVVWHPPYTLDLTSFLKPGKNELRIVVGNTAINALAGRTLPDYRLLNDRYGERFVPQDMDHLEPLPSGILNGLWLRVVSRR